MVKKRKNGTSDGGGCGGASAEHEDGEEKKRSLFLVATRTLLRGKAEKLRSSRAKTDPLLHQASV